MKENRNGPDGRLSRRAGRFAAVFVMILMSVVAGIAKAQWVPFSGPDSVPDRATHATAYDPVNDGIYMIGGTPSGAPGSHVNLCQRYDSAADTWTTMAPMPTARGWISAAYVKGKAHVIGGHSNASTYLAVNEEYTIATNSWAARAPLPVAVCAHMVGVWRDSLVYVLGGYNGSGIETVQVFNPFTNSWAMGTPLPRPADMSSAVIVGDTIYIPNAYDRSTGQLWGRMLKGAINPDRPTEITWHWGPWLPEPMGLGPKGTVSLHDKVYAFGVAGTTPNDTWVMTGWVYDPARGAYTESLPSLRLEGVGCWGMGGVVAREAADEIYQVAGTWDSAGGSCYHRLFVNPQGVGEAGSEVAPAGRLRVPALFRNGVRIHYELDRPCRATLTVYDQSGRVVRTIASGQVQAGSHIAAWDGRDEHGRPAGSGVYFCRLRAGEFTAARKLVKTE